MHKKLNTIISIDFPYKSSDEASLYIFQSIDKVPFDIKRVFIIEAHTACTRGHHAHKECAQLLVALKGQCYVTCDDGEKRQDFVLNSPSKGLLIPPTLWAEQDYSLDAVLMVLTDKPYDENDYIRDYDAFLNYRNSAL